MKRAVVIIVILGLLGLGAWYFFRSPSTPQNTTTTSNTLPFGIGDGSNGGGATTPNGTGSQPTSGTTALPHLFRISQDPVAGAIAFQKNGSVDVRYVERGTGHIFDVDPTSLAKAQIINTTVPQIYEALWNPDGSGVIFRTLSSDETTTNSVSLSLTPPVGTSTTDLYTAKSSVLPAGISELAVGQKNIFYSLQDHPQIVRSLFDGSKPSTLFTSGFNQWTLSATNDSTLFLTTKPSSNTDGYMYKLSSTGKLTKILGPLLGLDTLINKTGSKALYSSQGTNGLALTALDTTSGSVQDIGPVTLPDKCVWSTKSASVVYCGVPTTGVQNNEPDLWYQGKSHYSDKIWIYNIDGRSVDIIADPKGSFGVDIDAENLFLSPNEDYLFFQNRNDLSLWALKLD